MSLNKKQNSFGTALVEHNITPMMLRIFTSRKKKGRKGEKREKGKLGKQEKDEKKGNKKEVEGRDTQDESRDLEIFNIERCGIQIIGWVWT